MKHRIFRHNKIISALLLVFLLSGAFLNGCGRESVPYSESGFYFNTVIGAVYHYFQFETLDKMFTYLQRRQDGELYVELLWLGL